MDEPSLGIIEGFYGAPWAPALRIEQLTWAAARGYTTYVYAPKDDPLHRARWRDPYESAAMEHFAALTGTGVRVGWAVSPGLSFDHAERADLAALLAKLDQVLGSGIDLLCLALDDIPVRPGLGAAHASLVRAVLDHVAGRAALLLVPTDYTSTRSTPYLDALAEGVPADVPIAWTGPTVVCDAISVAEAEARASVLGRAPLLWDNHPVNDGLMVDRLFLGPLRGRPAALRAELSGYLANPMPQARASRPALASAASWWAGEDPNHGWSEEVDATGIRTLAEGCDSEAPRQLVDALARSGPRWQDAAGAAARWLERAATVDPDVLDGEAAPWVEQLRAEAEVGRLALRTLQLARPVIAGAGPARVAPPALRAAVEHAMALVATWQHVRRGTVSVLGPRASMRAVLSQHPSGEWRYHREALEEGRSALDDLVHLVLDAVADLDELAPRSVCVDGIDVIADEHGLGDAGGDGLGDEGARSPTVEEGAGDDQVVRIDAAAGSSLEVRWAGAHTACTLPATPPLPDRRLAEPD